MNQLMADLLIEECCRLGIRSFCLSPGSRNTPLTLAVARHPQAEAFLHFDERGAAFFALGQAKATRQPVALICTSGSAVANYYPAVVEAFQSRIPLILLTADRPPELLDCGANQAIRQHAFFAGYTRWETTLPCPQESLPATMWLTSLDQAHYRACTPPAGPVHLNCMFRDPLTPAPGAPAPPLPDELAQWHASARPFTAWQSPARGVAAQHRKGILQRLKETKRGLILLGTLPNPRSIGAVEALCQALGWPVFADITSGLRSSGRLPAAVPYYDQLLLSDRTWEENRPDTLLHLGGPITSKRMQGRLRPPCPNYYLVADHPWRQDPGHCLSGRIEADLEEFCAWLAPVAHSLGSAPWAPRLSQASKAAGQALDAFLATHARLSEIHVARHISHARPAGSPIFLGNSMPVRDMDSYADPKGEAGPVFANRGASGIDGLIATAAGIASAHAAPTTALLGDLSCLHDLNALALLQDKRIRLILVIINNQGGGIFSFLPIAGHKQFFDPYFTTPHAVSFEAAARAFGLPFEHPKTLPEFEAAYAKALAGQGASIIEVRTDREENFAFHQQLQAHMQEAIEAQYDHG